VVWSFPFHGHAVVELPGSPKAPRSCKSIAADGQPLTYPYTDPSRSDMAQSATIGTITVNPRARAGYSAACAGRAAFAARKRSASSAAMHPSPAEVTAWR
jgi:hypothetical protein